MRGRNSINFLKDINYFFSKAACLNNNKQVLTRDETISKKAFDKLFCLIDFKYKLHSTSQNQIVI